MLLYNRSIQPETTVFFPCIYKGMSAYSSQLGCLDFHVNKSPRQCNGICGRVEGRCVWFRHDPNTFLVN